MQGDHAACQWGGGLLFCCLRSVHKCRQSDSLSLLMRLNHTGPAYCCYQGNRCASSTAGHGKCTEIAVGKAAILQVPRVTAASRGSSSEHLLSTLCAVGLEGHWAGGVHSVAGRIVLTLPSSGPAVVGRSTAELTMLLLHGTAA
jgi:hypothetical protein